MSQVSTFVKFNDGNYYKNPILEDKDWFLCFDDDEPPELVIKSECIFTPEQILNKIGIKFDKIKFHQECSRYFGRKLLSGKSYFVFITEPPPIEFLKKFDAKCTTLPKTGGFVSYQWK